MRHAHPVSHLLSVGLRPARIYMKINKIKCDQCGTEHDSQEVGKTTTVKVQQLFSSTPHDFCNEKCLLAWLLVRHPLTPKAQPTKSVNVGKLPFKVHGVTCWYTGAVVRLCECGTSKVPFSPCLQVCTDGTREWASCPMCNKTWDTRTLKEWPIGATV